MQPIDDIEVTRRKALKTLTALAAMGLLPGCTALFRREPEPFCLNSPTVSLPKGPLTIDAHCHVFNGTDLQIEKFFSLVAVRQSGALGFGARVLGSLLEKLAWSSAPSGEAELAKLREMTADFKVCTEKEYASRLAISRQSAYTKGRQQLKVAVTKSSEFSSLQEKIKLKTLGLDLDSDTSAKVDALRLIEGLPSNVEDYHREKSIRSLDTTLLKGKTVQGLIDFVLQNFQYRYVSVHDYLRTYNEIGTRVVDLMLPSMVDYDFWLAEGEPTLTSLSTQVEVMQQIAIITGGRVHAFVPFDPLRQVAYNLKKTSNDSLSLVKEAINIKGCVGVKLYPPMGFAPLGNRDLKTKDGRPFWARKWLPEWTRRQELGQYLDDAMYMMLRWCEQNDVPIMAHTSISNGVSDDFEDLAGSKYWENALSIFPRLRVSFGHFGNSSPVEDGLTRARRFTALMGSDKSSGSKAFADAGYFVEVLGKQPGLLANLRQLYQDQVLDGRAPLASRFMYGTDWEMTLTEGSIGKYLADFVKLFDELEATPIMRQKGLDNLSGRFFGENAADWIGLHAGEPARARLDAFYTKSGVSKPDWALKLG